MTRLPPILVVDDEENLRQYLKSLLTLKGYDVVLAQDGEEALQRLSDGGAFSLIILDIMLPKMDGLEVFGGRYDRRGGVPAHNLAFPPRFDSGAIELVLHRDFQRATRVRIPAGDHHELGGHGWRRGRYRQQSDLLTGAGGDRPGSPQRCVGPARRVRCHKQWPGGQCSGRCIGLIRSRVLQRCGCHKDSGVVWAPGSRPRSESREPKALPRHARWLRPRA
jgi:hypothetical protein